MKYIYIQAKYLGQDAFFWGGGKEALFMQTLTLFD